MIKQDIYCLMVFLIKNSQLQRSTIPIGAWKVLEHISLKKIDATKRRPERIGDTDTESFVREEPNKGELGT